MECRNGHGWTPLLAAADYHEHTDGPHQVGPLFSELISLGADPAADLTASTASGEGPLDMASLDCISFGWQVRNLLMMRQTVAAPVIRGVAISIHCR